MQLTLEQQKERLVKSYMDILRGFKEFESFNKYVPLQERACKVMQYACNSNHDLGKLNIILGDYLVKNLMQCSKLEGHKLSLFYFVKSGTEKVPKKQRKKGGKCGRQKW